MIWHTQQFRALRGQIALARGRGDIMHALTHLEKTPFEAAPTGPVCCLYLYTHARRRLEGLQDELEHANEQVLLEAVVDVWQTHTTSTCMAATRPPASCWGLSAGFSRAGVPAGSPVT